MPEVEEEAVTALIRRTPLRRTRMKAWHPKPDPEHDAATQLARVSACLVCGKVGSCVPAHFPRARGWRGEPHPWHPRKWIPACGEPGACYQLLDRQLGVSAPIEERRQEALVKLEARAPLWWAQWKEDEPWPPTL